MAVVGARAAWRPALDAARVAVEAAAARGVAVVSGGALGVDAAMHRAALDLGVPQVAVLPLGPDRPYPPAHRELFAAILRSGGAVLHARPQGTRPTRGMFASRNRTVVELADGVVVTQAGARSGSVQTGRLGLAAGIPVGAVRGSAGCGALVVQGAQDLGPPGEDLRARLDAFVGELAGDARRQPRIEWPEGLRWLDRALAASPGGGTADELAARGGVSPATALMDLARAESAGLIFRVGPGRYVAS